MFCTKCGTALPDNARFCPECGAPKYVPSQPFPVFAGPGADVEAGVHVDEPQDGAQTGAPQGVSADEPQDSAQTGAQQYIPANAQQYYENPPSQPPPAAPYGYGAYDGGQSWQTGPSGYGGYNNYNYGNYGYGAAAPPPIKSGKKKKRAKILIPIIVVLVLAAAFVILLLTGVITIGQSNVYETPVPSATDYSGDDITLQTPSPPASITPSTPSIMPWAPTPPETPGAPSPGDGRQLSGSGGDVSVEGATEIYFTPDKSGLYTFRTIKNIDSDPNLIIYDVHGGIVAQNDDGARDRNSFIVAQLDGGTTYTVNAGFYDDSDSSYTLHVSPAEQIPAMGGQLRADGLTGLTFSPEQSGVWVFRTSDNAGCDPYLVLFDPNGVPIRENDDYTADKNAFFAIFLEKGSVYPVNAGIYGGESGNFTLTVAQAPEIPGGGGNLTVNGETVYAFTPDSSGMWDIFTSDNINSDPYLTLLDQDGNEIASDDESADNGNAIITVPLDAGTPYILIVSFYGGNNCKLNVNTSTAGASLAELPADGGVVTVNKPTDFSFSPDKDGIWVLHTADNGDSDPSLTLYEADGTVIADDDDGMGDMNAELVVYLFAGVRYNVRAEFYNDVSGSYSIVIKPPAMIPDDGGNIAVTAAQGFLFTPGKSGSWEFRTSNNGNFDPFITVYDADGNIIGDDDESGGDMNALLTVNLKAGETYNIYAGFYDNGPATYTLSVTLGAEN